MAIEAIVRCGRYSFLTRQIIGVGSVFRSSTGHVGVITGIGAGSHAVPTAEIVEELHKPGDADAWIDKTKQRRLCFRRACRQELAISGEVICPTLGEMKAWATRWEAAV